MTRRLRRALWLTRLWWSAHFLPEWHRYLREKRAKAAKAHKPTKHIDRELSRRVHAALRQEVRR